MRGLAQPNVKVGFLKPYLPKQSRRSSFFSKEWNRKFGSKHFSMRSRCSAVLLYLKQQLMQRNFRFRGTTLLHRHYGDKHFERPKTRDLFVGLVDKSNLLLKQAQRWPHKDEAGNSNTPAHFNVCGSCLVRAM